MGLIFLLRGMVRFGRRPLQVRHLPLSFHLLRVSAFQKQIHRDGAFGLHEAAFSRIVSHRNAFESLYMFLSWHDALG